MSDHPKREDAHAKARELMPDFVWDEKDPSSPFFGETPHEVLDALQDARDEDPRGNLIATVDQLLERWEVKNTGWDAVTAEAVHALGEDDEYSLLARDEIILAMAFGQLMFEAKIDGELKRRALLALTRQALPAFLHARPEPARTRMAKIDTLREALAKSWG